MKTFSVGKIKIEINKAKRVHLIPGWDYRDRHLLLNWLSVLVVISPAHNAWLDA